MAKEAAKRKCVTLRGRRKRMQVRCPHCGKAKTLEYRNYGQERRIYGATDIAEPSKQGE